MNYVALLAIATAWLILGTISWGICVWYEGKPASGYQLLVAFTIGPIVVTTVIPYILGGAAFDTLQGLKRNG